MLNGNFTTNDTHVYFHVKLISHPEVVMSQSWKSSGMHAVVNLIPIYLDDGLVPNSEKPLFKPILIYR